VAYRMAPLPMLLKVTFAVFDTFMTSIARETKHTFTNITRPLRTYSDAFVRYYSAEVRPN